MEFLPIVTKIVNVPDNVNKIFYTKLNFYNKPDTYNELLNMIQDYLYTDECYALIVDDEIFWNYYDENIKDTQLLIQNILRQKITEDPNLLFEELHNKTNIAKVILYIYEINPYKIVLTYNGFGKYSFEMYQV